MFTTWLLHGLDSEYDSFRMMLNNSRKAKQARGVKTEPEFDFILEQILNLDTQRKTSEARFMKSSSKPKDKKKDPGDLCPYCLRPYHIEEKCYYKHPERANQNFQERFKDRIRELQSKANATRSHTDVEFNIENVSEQYLSENRGLIAQDEGRILATGGHDKSWYFDNAASYHMTFDLADFQGATLMKCQHPQDDLILADGSTILPDGIGTVPILFCVNGHTEKISLSGVHYCPKLDTKLISLGMLDEKGLACSSQHGVLSV